MSSTGRRTKGSSASTTTPLASWDANSLSLASVFGHLSRMGIGHDVTLVE